MSAILRSFKWWVLIPFTIIYHNIYECYFNDSPATSKSLMWLSNHGDFHVILCELNCAKTPTQCRQKTANRFNTSNFIHIYMCIDFQNLIIAMKEKKNKIVYFLEHFIRKLLDFQLLLYLNSILYNAFCDVDVCSPANKPHF